VLIIPSYWRSQWGVIYTPSSNFSGAIAGRKKISTRGVSHAQSFTLFLFCFTLFLLASFYQKYKKIVPFIVVIFVGMLLSCFIMLSINGWFL
jgi:hypothetical protein